MDRPRVKVLVLDIEFSNGERERRLIEWGTTIIVGPRTNANVRVIPVYRKWRNEIVYVRVHGPEVPVLWFSEVDPVELLHRRALVCADTSRRNVAGRL